MTGTPKKGRIALEFLCLMLLAAVFIAAAPWLRSIDRTVVSLAGTAMSIFVMGYATYLSIRVVRGLDEVQKAGGAFGQQWGTLAGTIVFALLLSLPPVRRFATVLIWDWAGFPEDAAAAGRKVVVLAMTLGFCGLVVLQTIGAAVAASIWWRRLNR